MAEIHEGEPPDAGPDPEGTPLCTTCGRPVEGDGYYCPHCGGAVRNVTPYVPYVNIPFNYAPAARSIGNLMKGRE